MEKRFLDSPASHGNSPSPHRKRTNRYIVAAVVCLALAGAALGLGLGLTFGVKGHDKPHQTQVKQSNMTLEQARAAALNWSDEMNVADLVTPEVINKFIEYVSNIATIFGLDVPKDIPISNESILLYLRDMKIDELFEVITHFARTGHVTDVDAKKVRAAVAQMREMASENGINAWGISLGEAHRRAIKRKHSTVAETIEELEDKVLAAANSTAGGTDRRLLGAAKAAAFGPLCIPVVINVLQYQTYENGKSTVVPAPGQFRQDADTLIRRLNFIYKNMELPLVVKTATTATANTNIQFRLAELRDDYKKHPYLLVDSSFSFMYCGMDGSEDMMAKQALNSNVDMNKFINIIICGWNWGPAGSAWVPDKTHTPVPQDHVFLRTEGLSSKHWNNARSFWRGPMTLAHEIGHHLGLWHPHDGECKFDGDGVVDTPKTKDISDQKYYWNLLTICDRWRTQDQPLPLSYLKKKMQSCPTSTKPGDPVLNIMEYTADSCRSHFTTLQVKRLQLMIKAYRPKLYASSVGTCPTTTKGATAAKGTTTAKATATKSNGTAAPKIG